jgi:hypothetical protein
MQTSAIANRFKLQVASASDLQELFGVLAPNQERKVRSEELTSSEVQALNKKVVEHSFACWVQASREALEVLAGIRATQDGEAPFVTIGGKGYVFDRNLHNRPLSLTRVLPVTKEGTYSNLQARGLWGSGAGILVYTDEGEIASAQHTATGGLGAIEAGYDLSGLYYLCFFGLPPQYRDWSDKGRARNKLQDSFSDDSLFAEELFEELQPERTPPGKDQERERTGLLKLRSKLASNVLSRSGGKDISRTGDKLSWSEEKAYCNRFPSSQDMERLSIRLWEASKSQNGKQDRAWLDLFEPSILGACLVLASNSEEVIEAAIASEVVRGDDETPEDYTERKLTTRKALLSSEAPLRLNWDLVNEVLELVSTTSDNAGPLVKVFADLFARKNKDKRTDEHKSLLYSKLSIASMSACVELVKNIQKGDFESSVWTSYTIREGKAPTAYRCFGGLDCGYINSRKSKKSEE